MLIFLKSRYVAGFCLLSATIVAFSGGASADEYKVGMKAHPQNLWVSFGSGKLPRV